MDEGPGDCCGLPPAGVRPVQPGGRGPGRRRNRARARDRRSDRAGARRRGRRVEPAGRRCRRLDQPRRPRSRGVHLLLIRGCSPVAVQEPPSHDRRAVSARDAAQPESPARDRSAARGVGRGCGLARGLREQRRIGPQGHDDDHRPDGPRPARPSRRYRFPQPRPRRRCTCPRLRPRCRPSRRPRRARRPPSPSRADRDRVGGLSRSRDDRRRRDRGPGRASRGSTHPGGRAEGIRRRLQPLPAGLRAERAEQARRRAGRGRPAALPRGGGRSRGRGAHGRARRPDRRGQPPRRRL